MKPWLILPAPIAHALTPYGLPLVSRIFTASHDEKLEFTWKNLCFRNRFGIAGGVDKNAENILDWQRLGAGFLEIGTITPEPQRANPGRIIGRNYRTESLWNKMGFPNDGSLQVLSRLEKINTQRKIPLFVNVGKNRQTPAEKSYLDYFHGIKTFRNDADAFVLNISSPNTQGLRGLQGATILKQFLEQLFSELKRASDLPKKPFLLKLSPDMEESDFIDSLCVAKEFVDGFILTNTTTDRELTPFYPKEGGMSGAPLKTRSENALRLCLRTLGQDRQKFLIVSCGGIVHPEDAQRRLQMGADLVQTYSGLIYHGPWFFQDCCKHLKMV